MYRSIFFDGDRVLVDRERYLDKHDVVYRAPSYEGYEGMPLGNGDLGGMVFCTPESINLVVNKSDVIDFREDGNFGAWSWEDEEKNTAPVSCGRIRVSDGMPSFDWLYLDSFEQRLSLQDGCVDGVCSTPFSDWKFRSFVSQFSKVWVFEAETTSIEGVERKVKIEKWSSCNFFHYYEQVRKKTDKNLWSVKTGEKDGCIYLEQQLMGTHYVMAMTIVGAPYSINICNGMSGELIVERCREAKFKILISVVTSHTGKASVDEAILLLQEAKSKGNKLFENHKKAWKYFWEQSMVYLPDDDYLENIYYMNLYQLNSCSRGLYPVTFAGLWAWFKDTRNWGHFYHWNHQQTYWGVYTSGHPELAKNYLDYRFDMLGNARRDAKELFGNEGAFYSDITNMNGYQGIEPDTVCNYTVGPQIAMDFYRFYQYSREEGFLRERAFPVMKATADFYCGLLKKDEDGYYRIKGGSTPYESYWNLKETTSDRATIQALFTALHEVKEIVGLDETSAGIYREVLDNLYPLPMVSFCEVDIDVMVYSSGTKWNNERVRFAEGEYPLSPMPAGELSVIYPSGVLGLSSKGTPEFEVAVNTAKAIMKDALLENPKLGTSGHAPLPEVAARLGMRELCIDLLHLYVEKYQVFSNGLTHFADIKSGQFWEEEFHPRMIRNDMNATKWEKVHEKSDGVRTVLPNNNLLHCYFESASNIMTGINEMLLQSYDEIIRVFPGVPLNYSALFTLMAVGNYSVTAQMTEGDIRFIHILSKSGGVCKVENPWDCEISARKNGEIIEINQKDGILTFDTEVSGEYLLERAQYPISQYYKETIVSFANKEPKVWKKNVLGKMGVYS